MEELVENEEGNIKETPNHISTACVTWYAAHTSLNLDPLLSWRSWHTSKLTRQIPEQHKPYTDVSEIGRPKFCRFHLKVNHLWRLLGVRKLETSIENV